MKKRHSFKRTLSAAFYFAYAITLVLSGCKKFVTDPAPITSINSQNIYQTNTTAIAALTNIYAGMSSQQTFGSYTVASPEIITGLSSDELTLWSGDSDPNLNAYYANALSAKSANVNFGTDMWVSAYKIISICNAAIDGLNASTTLTPSVKQQLLGEAKFVRALNYFYLVNLYGGVPLALSSDYSVNATLGRATATLVYQQIISDLKDAMALLSANYLNGTLLGNSSERERPTKYAATALLARAYLYTGDWADAKSAASTLISNTSLFGLSPVSNVFSRYSAGNNEAIWQLQPVLNDFQSNTIQATLFIIPSTGPNYSQFVYLSNFLINSFEAGDQRFTNWVGSVNAGGTIYYYPYKYKATFAPVTEYETMFRLGEQYLIRADAEANNGDPSDAVNDLNAIRNRAGLPNYTGATDKTSLLATILHERQVELFTEGGHRWLDLKRTAIVNSVMSVVTPAKGGTWNSYQALYPLPILDLNADKNLVQNSGY